MNGSLARSNASVAEEEIKRGGSSGIDKTTGLKANVLLVIFVGEKNYIKHASVGGNLDREPQRRLRTKYCSIKCIQNTVSF